MRLTMNKPACHICGWKLVKGECIRPELHWTKESLAKEKANKAAEKIRRIISRDITKHVEYSLAVRPVVDDPADVIAVQRFCAVLQSGQDYLARCRGELAE